MTVHVRFAPSPTGLLHVGNIRTALLNHLFARGHGGRLLLRYDDTDRTRSKPAFAEAIATDLAWLGVQPDHVVRQSDRLALYDDAAARLRSLGLLYPCYETPDELERMRRRRLARGLPPIYDRAAMALSDADRARLEGEGRRPYWRFRLSGDPVVWDDLCRGPHRIETSSLSDPVLVRDDGTFLYTLTSVVDDGDLGITHVIRGEDHITNNAVQVEIFAALGAAVPRFAHHNLLAAASGEALSKRLGALSIASLREAGYEPMAVATIAVLTGSAEPVQPYRSLDELARHVALDRLSHATAKFDPRELDGLNARYLREAPFEAVADRLADLGVGGGAAFWTTIRGNVALLREARTWWDIVSTERPDWSPPEEEHAFLNEAAALLPPEPWDEGTWPAWTAAISERTGRRGKAVYRPLRLALTGREHGPEMRSLMTFIGRRRTSARLS